MAKLEFVGDNQLVLLHTGSDYFSTLIKIINQARNEIYLESYIFSHDTTAREIQNALGNAAQRGVHVQVIVDWVGSGNANSPRLQQELCAVNVACRRFNPWFSRGLVRTHRKIVVIDAEIALVGGINIIDDALSDDGLGRVLAFPRWDFAVQVTGQLVAQIHKEIEAQWRKLGKLEILTRLRIAKNLRLPNNYTDHNPSLAALVVRDNLRNRATIQRAYLKALGNAKSSAILANPYFAPGRKIRNGLISAANRGVEVSLLLGVGEFGLQDAIAQSFYPKLLANGVRIIEYRKTQLHAKVAVIDDEWATVGSSNFDGLSLFVNQEANIVIKDKAFAEQLTAHLIQGIAEGIVIDESSFVKQAWYRRLSYHLAYLLYHGIMHIATLGKFR